MRRAATIVCLLLAAATPAAGCGASGDVAAVESVTARYYEAIRRGDGPRACELLSAEAREQLEGQAGEPCERAVTELDHGGGRVEAAVVYVTNAKVDLRGGESAFLGLKRDGWRLTAVACRADTGAPRDRPLDCELEG